MATSVYLGGGGGGTPASPTTSVQFNNAGAFGGSANFEWLPSLNVQGLSNAFSSIDDTMNFLPTLNVVKASTWPVTTTSIVGSINGNILNVIDTTDDWTPFGIHAGVDKDHLYEVIKLTYNNDGSGRMSGAFLLNGIGNGGSNGAAIYGDFDSGLVGNFYGLGTYSPATTLEVVGNVRVTSLPTATEPVISNVGTPGATTYDYVVVNKSGSTHAAASNPGATATGNATLNGTNYNVITISEVDASTSYDIYRTVGGATQGLIGNTRDLTFNDTGLVGDGSTAPTTDTTGRLGIGINPATATLDVRGSVNLQGLNSDTPSEIDIVAGSGNTGNTPGAPVVITAGDGNGSGLGGSVFITAGGSGSGTVGNISLTTAGGFVKLASTLLAVGNQNIETGVTTSNSLAFRAYDVDGANYKTFMTLTSQNVPDLTIGPVAGATVTLQASTYLSADGSTGATTTVTTGSLVGKTMTFKNGLLTSFA